VRYWEQQIPNDPVFQLVSALGMKEAAEQMSTTVPALEQVMTMTRYRYDTKQFSADQLYITSKLGELSPLNYNKGQNTICTAIEEQRIAGVPVRCALLKARQFGGSTKFEAEIFKDTIMREFRRSMIIAHDLDSARWLRDMSERYYNHYKLKKPIRKIESDKWWKFKHQNPEGYESESSLLIDTADELTAGHSLTIHNLHCSEIQNWRNAKELVKGLFPTVPKNPDTMIFMEGTGCGVGDYWYDFVQMAQEDTSTWKFIFVPWYDVEDYTAPAMTPDEACDFMAHLDGLEEMLAKVGVTPSQLKWRRTTIHDDYNGILEDFQTQYPATPDEAFLTSGRPVFASDKVRRGMAKVQEPNFVGDLLLDSRDELNPKVTFNANERGLWSFWEMPDTTIQNLYVAGVDVAEGKAIIPELGLRGGDYSCAKILRRDNNTFTGLLRARIDPDLLGVELYKASIFYGRLPMMIENNPGGSGNVVVRDLKRRPGVNLLRRVNIRKNFEKRMDEPGWRTMKDTKREMIDELIHSIRDGGFYDPSKNFWKEASTYLRDEKGLTDAQRGKYDDEVMAAALTWQGHELIPQVFKVVKERKVIIPRDRDVKENWGRRPNEAITQRQVMEDNYAK